MRSSEQFLEITGDTNNRKFLLNKSSIVFVTQRDSDEKAVIVMEDGNKAHHIYTKERYADIAEELLCWSDEIREDENNG